jgi:hypothetical protein
MKITAAELRKIINETVMSKIAYHNTHQILEVDTDGSGDLSPDELRDLADELEGEPIIGQELRDALISNISDMHKDIYSKRPDAHDLRQLPTEELEQEHHKTSEAHKDWWYEERHREDQDMWIADEDSEIEALMDPEEGEDEPKQIGMGRRPLVGPARDVRRGKKISENKMKITRRQLRQTIFEACGGGCDSVDSPSEHADSDWKNSDSVNTLGDIDDMRPQDAFALGLVIGRSNNLDNMSDPPTVEDAFYPEEVEAREDAWSGGDNIEDPLDHADFETGESNTGPHVSTIRGCTMREMKITRRQLRQIIKEELSLLESNSDSDDHDEKLDPDLLKGAYVSSREDREAMKDYIAKLKAKKKSIDSDGDGALDAHELRDLADDLEGEGQQSLESFRLPYKGFGYGGRRIISRDRAWLEFVPKGAEPSTQEDMFRSVTLLDQGDPEVEKVIKRGGFYVDKYLKAPVDNYDIYSVHATTTG